MEDKHTAIKNHFTSLRKLGEPHLIKYIIDQQNNNGFTPLMLACMNVFEHYNLEYFLYKNV